MAVFHGEYFYSDPACESELRRAGIGPGSNWAEQDGGAVLSASGYGQVRRLDLNDQLVIFYKTERYSCAKRLKFWLRPARTTVEVFAYDQLQAMNIPTLDAIAYGERRLMGLPTESFVATREVEASQDLRTFAVERWQQMDEPDKSRVYTMVATKLADQLSRAHAHGFVHHDLKWRNVLIQDTEEGYQPVWIDPPRAAMWRWRRRRGAVVDLCDLASLAVLLTSKYDRMRFVLRYLGERRAAGTAAALCRSIDKRLSRRDARTQDLRRRDPATAVQSFEV